MSLQKLFVPSAQCLFKRTTPGPQDLSVSFAVHIVMFFQSPTLISQSGKLFLAILQETFWINSTSVHLSTVPSAQSLFCCDNPGPQLLLLPSAKQLPTVCQFPITLSQLGKLHETFLINNADSHLETVLCSPCWF